MPVKGGSDEDSKKDVRSQRFSDEWRRVAAVERPPPVRESLGSRGGVQLWSVREQLKENWDGTLHQLAAIGYREVELFETPKSPGEFRRGVENAGLKCVGGHFELKDLKDPATIAAAQQLGLTYMILVFPALPSLEGQSVDANFEQFVPRYEKISLCDYKWNAEQLNLCAENLKRHGIRTGMSAPE